MRFLTPLLFLITLILSGCSPEGESGQTDNDDKALARVIYIQQLYNLYPGGDIVPEMEAVVDSMRREGRNPYYYAAVNVLIDRLFSEGHFAEADSLAVRMMEEATAGSDSLSLAMARRVRAQMFFKLAQSARAQQELAPAGHYISDPYRSGPDFGTAASIQEWLWIIARELRDTVAMNQAGRNYARLVKENGIINNWTDSTGHYPVSALAFRAEEAFSKGDIQLAGRLLDSAGIMILPALPSRAYEHFYTVRSKVRATEADWAGAIADADTLLATHREFPWFYLRDLLLKAEILNQAGKHEESAAAYSEYVSFHDSLSNRITDRRLHDLTLLYRTELDREQQRAERFRMFAFGVVILLLIMLLIIAILNAAREKKRNRLLVKRLRELDRATGSVYQVESKNVPPEQPSVLDTLDRHMFIDRPYINPALGRKELAEYCGIAPDALGHLIKTEKGLTVVNYINSFRLEEARRILGSDSTETVADIAVRLGFGTVRTLQRAFKERYDMSPTQYRDTSNELESSTNQ